MAESSFFSECQSLITRRHESWKSFFSKWELFAKHEENTPESELFIESLDKAAKTRKMKQAVVKAKPKKTLSLLSLKGKQKRGKKYIKKNKFFARNKIRNKIEPKLEECKNSNTENLTDLLIDFQMETLLKAVFTDILKAKRNNSEIFAVLSQTFPVSERTNPSLLINSQQMSPFNNFHLSEESYLISKQIPSTMPEKNLSRGFLYSCIEGSIQNLEENLNLSELGAGITGINRKFERVENLNLYGIFPKFEFSYKNMNQEQFLLPSKNQTPLQGTQPKFGIKSCRAPSLNGPKIEIRELKPLETNLGLTSSASVFRKINREYFTKKIFPKMNITQDGKRFRKLCLHKRTNSVSLSMENSKFITPERKPSERKCLSENVLQRKRRCPSKLFFDDEVGDPESDDQTETRVPLIYCKNKIKTKIIPKVIESDSDDESIFDRIKKP